jgi:hypothetical protein
MKLLFTLLALLFVLPLSAQRVRQVCGEATYYAEGNETPNQAKLAALEAARLQAIAAEFGTLVSQSTTQNESLNNGRENIFFSQLSATEVKGEWLEDIGEPEYEISYVQDMLVVKCRVCGRARELTNEAVDFTATVLRNGTEAKFADVGFRNGDDFYLLFRAPVDGYVVAYLVDETPTAYCLLPYMSNTKGQQAVRHNEEYVFFAQQKAPKGETVDEYTLTCSNDMERNQIYVIFSPNPFTKALDSQVSDGVPRQLAFEEFQKWLTTSRRRDTQMGVKVMHIEIKP